MTVQLIRKHKLREEYALVWLAASATIVIFAIFGDLVNLLAASFAVTYAPTLILAGGLFFALVILLSQSVVLSGQAKCIRDLAQTVSLLEWRLRQMEGDPPATAPPDPLRGNEAPPGPPKGGDKTIPPFGGLGGLSSGEEGL